MVQRYEFESKSQLIARLERRRDRLFPMVQRYEFESKSQLDVKGWIIMACCFQWFKDTNLKANHNREDMGNPLDYVVSNGSKILI